MIVYQKTEAGVDMELIIISESKIKLMLTSRDMEEYSKDEDAGHVVRSIMSAVRHKYGYSGMDGRIFVQMYLSRGGGCEMFVTKLDERAEETGRIFMEAGDERTMTELKRYMFGGRVHHVIYSFETMEYMLRTCLGLWKSGYVGESLAYVDRVKRMYYLLLNRETHIAGENLGSLCPSRTYYYINEHCDMLCEDAVAVLGRLA